MLVLELSLILWGAAAATLGWYWGGVTEGRTSWVPIGAAGVLLGGITIFAAGGTPLPVWAFAAVSAIGATLVAATLVAYRQDRRTVALVVTAAALYVVQAILGAVVVLLLVTGALTVVVHARLIDSEHGA